MIDTLRPDRLGAYGYALETSPNIDAFANRAIRYTRAVAQSSWTRPTVASLLSSTYPGFHSAEDRPDIVREGVPSLAGTLRQHGYVTCGIVTNPNVHSRYGFGRGFDRYVEVADGDDVARDRATLAMARAALDDLADRPWMMYVHWFAPHAPYEPPPPYDTRFPPDMKGLAERERHLESVRSRYDGEIAFADQLFGDLIDHLAAQDALDNTMVVFVSDHGEQFYEHGGFAHGNSLFDEELMVPLIIKPPHFDEGPVVVDEVAELVDIAPTILDYAGLPPNPRFQGISLAGDRASTKRFGFAQLRLEQRSLRCVRSEQYKYIYDMNADTAEFYDLIADPGEQSPMAEPLPDAAVEFADFARYRAMSDTSGLHVLMTEISRKDREIQCEIVVPGMTEYNVRDLGGAIVATREGDSISVSGVMKYNAGRWWGKEVALDNYVHIHVQTADITGSARITFELAGPARDEPVLQSGEDRKAFPINGEAIALHELIAQPDHYELATLPEAFALYAWYVPPVETLSDEELPTDILEQLEAMGYIQ